MKTAFALQSRRQRIELAKTAQNKLTADRSTTELRWITQLKNRESVFSHDSIEATHNRIHPEGPDAAV
jgi:hypothetical protein